MTSLLSNFGAQTLFSSLSPKSETNDGNATAETAPAFDPATVKRVELSYDKRSVLFKALEQQNWQGVIDRSAKNPEEAQPWYQTKEMIEFILPLHYAIRLDAPADVISALVNAYAGALQLPDNKGRLAMHMETSKLNMNNDVVKEFLSVYPDACAVQDLEGRIALSIYDKNKTQLFRLIEAKKWHDAVEYAKANPMEASIWVARLERNENVRWRLTPLHAAVIYGAPPQVIDALLNVDPVGAARKDDEGMLPIHSAFRSNSDAGVIDLLLKAHPEGIKTKDNLERIPFAHSTSIHRDRKEVVTVYADAMARFERNYFDQNSDVLLQEKIQGIQKKNEENIASMKEAEAQQIHRKNVVIVRMKEDYDSQIARLKQEMADKLSLQGKEFTEKLSSKQESYTKLEKESQDEISQLKEELSQCQSKLKNMEDIVYRKTNVVDDVMKMRADEDSDSNVDVAVVDEESV